MSDFFIKNPKTIPQRQVVDQENVEAAQYAQENIGKQIPPEYIPVTLSSMGKLSMPATLHVRDYKGEDALNLATTAESEKTLLQGVISVLEGITYEGIDAKFMHEKEAEELLLNVRLNFWDSEMQAEYPIEDEKELSFIKDDALLEKIVNGDESLYCTIPVRKINTKPIPDKFKEPFSLSLGDKQFTFILPRIGDLLTVQDFIDKKYAHQIQKFQALESSLRYNQKIRKIKPDLEKFINPDSMQEYVEYIVQRNKDYMAVKQALVIVKAGSTRLETVEQKMKAYRDVPREMWETYTEITSENSFGVQPEVEVISPITGDPVTRRFQFRFQDYLSKDESKRVSKVAVQFGE